MKYGKDWICRSEYYDGYCDAPSTYECAKMHGMCLNEETPRTLTETEIEEIVGAEENARKYIL